MTSAGGGTGDAEPKTPHDMKTLTWDDRTLLFKPPSCLDPPVICYYIYLVPE